MLPPTRASCVSSQRPIRPRPLPPGTGKIGLIAPASAARDPDALERGVAYLQQQGYQIVRGRSAYEPLGYLSGTDDARLTELNRFLRSDDVQALFCVRGGYGSLRLLPHLDYDAARAKPKLLVGYSDITALHMALFHRAGWPGISGLMVESDFAGHDGHDQQPHPATERLFWALAEGATPDPLLGPAGEALEPEQSGTAEGVLLGGNLSMLAKLVGTPYLPPMDGAILFVEEIGEAPYRIDGLLAQLRLAGILERLSGLVYGQFTDTDPRPPTRPLGDVLAEYAAFVNGPVARGLVYGHVDEKSALPVGVRARLEVTDDDAALSILEPVVAD
ncbi:MAG: LD-carboxypeptidase [Bacteroidetes bacterium QH_8_67_23]|nr:MAG: LD-carboxypeptidase [Bacteroidetes bacterium QH_8_67_23]